MIGSTVLIFFFFFSNQAAIQVSGEALALAYTSKSFQWHLQLHSCFTGTLLALHTAASGKVAPAPGAPSPRRTISTPTSRLPPPVPATQTLVLADNRTANHTPQATAVYVWKKGRRSLLTSSNKPCHCISLVLSIRPKSAILTTPPKSCQTTTHSNCCHIYHLSKNWLYVFLSLSAG